MSRRMAAAGLGCALLVLLASHAAAIPPLHVADTELAKAPIVVVAHWKGAPFQRHTKYSVQTEIVVERVIHGDLEPGVHSIAVGFAVGWQPAGGVVRYYGSTEMVGDVDDVKEANLWFLGKVGEKDRVDEGPVITLWTYRGVQPLTLAPWFAALRASDPRVEIPKLLASRDAEMLRRALVYVAGEKPWPFGDRFWDRLRPEESHAPLLDAAQAVAAVLDGPVTEVRSLAAAVLVNLQGSECIPRMRSLLEDPNPAVRAVAICVLSKHEDSASTAHFERAAQDIEDGTWGCKIVAALAAWGDPAVVPALIGFLQSDDCAYQYGDDYGVPALKAREALHALTGHWFPYDVGRARTAWQRVASEGDRKERRLHLAEILPGLESPLVVDVVSRADGTRLRVRNRGDRPLTVSCTPAWLNASAASGCSGSGWAPATDREGFLALAPDGTHEVPVEIPEFILRAEPETRVFKVFFGQNGNEWGVGAWIGVLDVAFGPDWKEPPRVIVPVEERWPNGNLKVQGQTLNGTPYGTWTHYNEQGDRIRSTSGGSLSEHNPNHAANKGLGIPKKDSDQSVKEND